MCTSTNIELSHAEVYYGMLVLSATLPFAVMALTFVYWHFCAPRLKRILNQERKESFIAAHGGEDPLAMAMMQQQSSVNPSTKTDVGLIESVDGKNKDKNKDDTNTDNSNDNNNAEFDGLNRYLMI